MTEDLLVVFKLSLIDGIGNQLGPSYFSRSYSVRESVKYSEPTGRPCLELKNPTGVLQSIRNRFRDTYDRGYDEAPDGELEGGFNVHFKGKMREKTSSSEPRQRDEL